MTVTADGGVSVAEDLAAESSIAKRLTPTVTLCVAAVGFAALQFALFDENRFLEWDEAVYSARASDRFGDIPWQSHRALGVPVVLSPLFAVTSSFWLMRIWLVLVSTAALALGFGTWRRSVGHGAGLGLAAFATSWIGLFYGSEASPNLYVAACAVGAAGLLTSRPGAVPIRSVGITVALAVLFRPSDGFIVAAGVVTVAMPPRLAAQRGRILAASVVGAIAGFVPWLVEAWMWFGGPASRWGEASSLVKSGLRWQVGTHLRLLDGPLVGPDPAGDIPAPLVLILVALVVIVALGLATEFGHPVAVALGFSALLAVPYAFYVGVSAPRFLLPAVALLAAAAGAGWAGLGRKSMAAGFGVGVVIVSSIAVSGSQAVTFESDQAARRSEFRGVGSDVRELAAGAPCRLLSQYGGPQLTVTSGCVTERLLLDELTCQVDELPANPEVLIVSFVGPLPPELVGAAVSDTLDGPSSWSSVAIDPSGFVCNGDGRK